MAEFVQLRKEKWIDTANWLRKLKILKNEECRTMIGMIDNHEYKIQTPNRKLEHVLEYVQFLSNLLKLIQHRRKILGQYDKTDEVDRFIYNDIGTQFGSAEINFSHTAEFWNARLKFIATIVPEPDRENEFNRVFKKALNYYGRASLDFYKLCVDIQWSFLQLPKAYHSPIPKKKKRRLETRDCSKLMIAIREITREALRNLSRSADVTIWVITTELKYISIVKKDMDKNEKYRSYDPHDEMNKSEKLIAVLFQSLCEKHNDPAVFIQLFEEIKDFGVPQSQRLSDEVFQKILQFNPKRESVVSWLIDKTANQNRIDECLKIITDTLWTDATNSKKTQLLSICVEKLNKLLQLSVEGPKYCFPRLIKFAMDLFDLETSKLKEVTSESFLVQRIQFLKSLPNLLDEFKDNDDEELKVSIKSFQSRHKLEHVVRISIQKCPRSYTLVKERIFQLFAKGVDSVKPSVIVKLLSNVNWKNVEEKEAKKFLHIVYYAFVSTKKFQTNLEDLMTSLKNTTMLEEIRVLHLRKLYMEDIQLARKYYLDCSKHATDWKLSCLVIEVESDICRGSRKASAVFLVALETMQKLAGTSSTEPWKIGITCLRKLNLEKEASQLLKRALSEFSSRKELKEEHKDLMMFSAEYRTL